MVKHGRLTLRRQPRSYSIIILDIRTYRAVACDVTSAAFNQNVWQNVWRLYRERCVLNYSVAVERVTAKPLWYDNRLSVGNIILEG